MEQIKVKFKGINSIVLHNNQAVSPFNKYSHAMKGITKKKNKTENDWLELGRIEWESGLYLNEKGTVVIPSRCIKACLKEAAKIRKLGKVIEKSIQIGEIDQVDCVLSYEGSQIKVSLIDSSVPNPNFDQFYKDHRYDAVVGIKDSSLLRVRPIFRNWHVVFNIYYFESFIDLRTLQTVIEDAGRFIGLCDGRPDYGKFTPEIYKY